MIPSDDFLDFDQVDNIIDNLEMLLCFLNLPTNRFPLKWKWVFISLHQALYGLAIITLQGSDPRETVYFRKKDGSLGKLISFDKAIERLTKPEYTTHIPNYHLLVISSEEQRSLYRLSTEFRDEFVHFKPIRWAIGLSEFPPIIKNVYRIIHFLTTENYSFGMSIEQKEHLDDVICRLDAYIKTKFN